MRRATGGCSKATCASKRRRGWRSRPPARALLSGLRDLAQARERAPYQARDLHLRDADAFGDLRLGEVFGEAQVQDQAVSGRERVEGGGDRGPVLDELVALVVAAD